MRRCESDQYGPQYKKPAVMNFAHALLKPAKPLVYKLPYIHVSPYPLNCSPYSDNVNIAVYSHSSHLLSSTSSLIVFLLPIFVIRHPPLACIQSHVYFTVLIDTLEPGTSVKVIAFSRYSTLCRQSFKTVISSSKYYYYYSSVCPMFSSRSHSFPAILHHFPNAIC